MASEKLATGYVELTTKGAKKAERDLDRLGRKFKQTGGMASDAARAITTAFSGAAILAGIKSTAEAYLSQERSVQRLNAAFLASGRTSGFAAKQVALLADQMERSTMFSDDAVRSAGSLLAAYENLSGNGLRDVLVLSADVATVMGADVPDAARLLGMALNDPVKGLRGLRQAGINFTEAEKEVLKTMAETNRLGEAQAIILERVEKRFKGAAQAAKEGIPAIADNLKKSVGNMQEALGAYWAGQISPRGSGVVELQDLPFAFAGDQAGKEAYQRQLEVDARTAANASNAAGGNVAAARQALADAMARMNQAGDFAAPPHIRERWRGREAELEAEIQRRRDAIRRDEVLPAQAALTNAEDSQRRLAREAEAKKAKQAEFQAAVDQAEYYKTLKDRLAAAKEGEDQMAAFEAARTYAFELRQKSLAEQDDMMRTMDEARQRAIQEEVARLDEQAMVNRNLMEGLRAGSDAHFNQLLEDRMNQRGSRMGLAALESAIQQAALTNKDLIPKQQLQELKDANKGLKAMDANLKKMNQFGAGAVA